MGGDFNVVRFPSKRSSSTSFTATMWECSGKLPLLLCGSLPILFLSKASLIFRFKGDLSLGLILVKLLHRLGWTNFCFLQIRRISFHLSLNDACLGYYLITSQLFLRVVPFKEVGGRLDLRICGLKMRVLWRGCDLGGNLIMS